MVYYTASLVLGAGNIIKQNWRSSGAYILTGRDKQHTKKEKNTRCNIAIVEHRTEYGGYRVLEWEGGALYYWGIKEDLSNEMIFGQRPGWSKEWVNHADVWGRPFQIEGPESAKSLRQSSSCFDGVVARTKWEVETVVPNEIREIEGPWRAVHIESCWPYPGRTSDVFWRSPERRQGDQ